MSNVAVKLFGWLSVAAALGCNDSASASAAMPSADAGVDAGSAFVSPRIASAPWTIAHSPDLGAIGSPNQQPVDFGIWQAADGTWQLWSCIRGTNVGGNTRLFYRWEGQNLTSPDWTPKGVAMEADTMLGETAGGLQAPFVIVIAGKWHMFYGDWEHICHATSDDGKTFTRVVGADGKTGLFTEGIGLNTRDPMVLFEKGVASLYYTTSEGIDYVRTSRDLASFGAAKRVAFSGSAGTGPSSAECPFVVHPRSDALYFLFRTQHYGGNAETRVYRSPDPSDFGVNSDRYLVETLPVAAPEIVHVGADWYIAWLTNDLKGIQVARLAWTP